MIEQITGAEWWLYVWGAFFIFEMFAIENEMHPVLSLVLALTWPLSVPVLCFLGLLAKIYDCVRSTFP